MARSALLTVISQAVMRAGRTLSRDFGEIQSLQVSIKGPGDFVEKSRTESAKAIRETLLKARPAFGMVLNGKRYPGTDPQNRWLIDSLGGRANFLHGQPHFAISVALEREHQIVAGVVFNPIADEFYAAEKGRGTFLNDRRLRVSGRSELGQSLIGSSQAEEKHNLRSTPLKQLALLSRQVDQVRNFGCTALELAQVSSGCLDGSWHGPFELWQIAAASILVREAGGTATDTDGEQNLAQMKNIIAGNFKIQAKLRAELASSN